MSVTKRLSKPTRELQARLLRALNDGFTPPKTHATPFYRLRDGKNIRKASHLIVFQAMEDWDNRDGHTLSGLTRTQSLITSAFSDEALAVAFMLRKLSPDIRKFIYEFVQAQDQS